MSQGGHHYPPQQPYPQYQQPYQPYQQQYPQHIEQGYAPYQQQQPMLPPAGYQHGYYPRAPHPQQPQPAFMYQQPGQFPQPPGQFPQVAPGAQYPPTQGMHMPRPPPRGQVGMYPAGALGVPAGPGYPSSSSDAAYNSHVGGQMHPPTNSQQNGSGSQQHQHHPGQQGQQQQNPRPPPPQGQQQAVQGQHAAPEQPLQQGPGIPQYSVGNADSSTAAGGGDTGNSSHEQANSGSVLLAALQNQQGAATNNREDTVETAAAPAGASSTTTPAAVTGVDTFAAAAGSSSSSIGHPVELAEPQGMGRPAGAAGSSTSSSKQQGSQERVDPWGVYLVGLQPDITSPQLYEIFSAYGKVKNVAIITVKYHTTKCAFVNFLTAAAASKVLAEGIIDIGGHAVTVRAKVKGKAAAQAQGEASSSGQAQQPKQKQKGTKQAGSAGAGPSNAAGPSARVMGHNEEGLPMLRGAPCCPFYMGTGECAFRNNCRYHHPMHAFHPECVLAGKKPVRYNDAITPYARLVNHTERLWDYDSCAEAQLKIWLARHLIASENSGCGMFDESAAVPAADEYDDFPNEAQPLGPYSCSIAEADQVLQLLWKAQPDEASQQVMPYKGRVWHLLSDDPYYKLEPDPSGYADPHKSWVQLRLANIKGLLNY